MKKLIPRDLKGKTACGLLADWFDELSAKMKKGEDPSVRMAFTGEHGRECVVEFRALSVPGEFERVSFKLEGKS